MPIGSVRLPRSLVARAQWQCEIVDEEGSRVEPFRKGSLTGLQQGEKKPSHNTLAHTRGTRKGA